MHPFPPSVSMTTVSTNQEDCPIDLHCTDEEVFDMLL